MATAVIHNIAKRRNERDFEEEVQADDDVPVAYHGDQNDGFLTRQYFVNNFF